MRKKGWIRIVESFIAILLIVGVFFAVLNTQKIDSGETSERIYNVQVSILRNIQLDSELRNDTISVDEDRLPITWDEFDESNGLENVRNRIENKTPSYLVCEAQVCNITKPCVIEEPPADINIYSRSVGITATTETYNPKQLKLFCWLR